MSNEPLGNPSPRQFTLRSLFMVVAVVALALGMIVPAIRIPWAAPRDLEADKITFHVNGRQTLGISSEHPGGAYCLLCDGSVTFLPDSMAPAQVRAMCTICDQDKAEK